MVMADNDWLWLRNVDNHMFELWLLIKLVRLNHMWMPKRNDGHMAGS